ncbi:MAG: CHASE2 domain-containing protein [Nitrospirota bacterium]
MVEFFTRRWIRWAGVLAMAMLGLFGVFERLELIAIDLRYRLATAPPRQDIVLVVIDQHSLKAFPRWPWPRRYYADAITALKRDGARMIAVDVDFSARSEPEDDRRLVEAVAEAGNVILGVFQDQQAVGGLEIVSANLPFQELAGAAAGMGSLLLPMDADGAIRRALVAGEIHGRSYRTLAAEIAFRTAPERLERVGARAEDGAFYIEFAGNAGAFRSVPFADVLDGRVPPSAFHGAMVLIGATALELNDLWNTPHGLAAGVAIQASALQTLLSGSPIVRLPPWTGLLALAMAALLLDVAVVRSFQRHGVESLRRFVAFTASTAAVIIAYGAGAVYGFLAHSVLLDMAPFAAGIAAYYLLASIAFNLAAGQSVRVKTMTLSAIHSVGQSARAEQPLEESLESLFAMAKDVLDVRLAVLDVRPPGPQPSRRIVKAVEGGGLTDEIAELCRPWAEQAARSRASVIVSNLQVSRRWTAVPADGFRSSLFLPLLTQRGQHGVLHLHSSRPGVFTDEEVTVLFTIANQLAMNIENLDLIREVKRLFSNSIEAFSTALELRDNETEGHSQRVAIYAVTVAKALGLDPGRQETLRQGALLHDIGKIGVPDAILRKQDRLTPEEASMMHRHPEFGYWMLKHVEFPEEVALTLLHHHEQFDGSGYPAGLRGEEIAIYARIFSVVDAYDAIRSDRPYRKGTSYEEAVKEIRRCAGRQFDPNVVAAFLELRHEQLEEIRYEISAKLKARNAGAVFSAVKST